MNYRMNYICVCNCGRYRQINQDNYICENQYRNNEQQNLDTPIQGEFTNREETLLGVFDGLGGEACGDIASLLAAQTAAEMKKTNHLTEDILELCFRANDKICQYEQENNISSMGTTAAMLLFGKRNFVLCNIGDSKIYRIEKEEMLQVSIDHVLSGIGDRKPSLSQSLGIDPEMMLIQPYVEQCNYQDGDIYLIASDGLTDMVSEEKIREVIANHSIEEGAPALLQEALQNGGKDNITIILCQIQKVS